MTQLTRKRKTLQQDGINIELGLFVDRSVLVEEIFQTAEEGQHVVLSSPPATGKSSLLDLMVAKLESSNERVFYCVPDGNSERMKTLFRDDFGLPTANLSALRKVQRFWILIDDAQRGYSTDFDDMWAFVIKDLNKNPHIKVIIAATHDMTTLGSPAAIGLLPHVFKNFSGSEVDDLITKFCSNFQIPKDGDWEDHWNAVRELSLIASESTSSVTESEYHVGVILRCLLDLERARKIPNAPLDGQVALRNLRSSNFIQGFDRCFAVNTKMIEDATTRARLTDVLVGQHNGVISESLKPLVRGGVLTTYGAFSCQAATWFYNQIDFPNRASRLPSSLQELVTQAVQLLSSTRLKACVQDKKFPLETSFQHLLNEAMTSLLPTDASIKPEYWTKAPGFMGDTKRGFIDFYVNDTVQWAVELLRLGSGLTEHRNRFHPITGKYRTLPTKKHLVVDIRGPRDINQEVSPQQNLCVLYFSADWSTCSIQMETEPDKEVNLRL